jgi:hypothetical protein
MIKVWNAKDPLFEPQEEFHMPDETRPVGWIKNSRCPRCGLCPRLWRIIPAPGAAPVFQVRCVSDGRNGSYLCDQTPVPQEPLADSQKAAQSWMLYVKLAKG